MRIASQARQQLSDGSDGQVDLASEFKGPVCDPLRDVAFFRQFRMDPAFHALVWPNGADMAPEILYRKVRLVA